MSDALRPRAPGGATYSGGLARRARPASPGPRRPGRPVRLPREESAGDADPLEPDVRVAWLLMTHRLSGTRPELAHRADFVELLRDRGVTADASRISRWEGGQQSVPTRVLEAYEALLGLPAWSLVTLQRGLTRLAGSEPGRLGVTLASAEVIVEADDDLETLLELARAPGASLSGSEWLRLADQLTRFQAVFLDRAGWAALCGRLLEEISRTTGWAGLLRYEAGATLASHPVAGRHLVSALAAWAADPRAQRLNASVSLLAVPVDPACDQTLAGLVTSANPITRDAAEGTIAARLAHRLVGPALLARLERRLVRRLGTPSARVTASTLDVVAHLPPPIQGRVLAAVGHPGLRQRLETVLADRLLVRPEAALHIVGATATEVRGRTAGPLLDVEDPMLERLVREALFHVNAVRRWAASSVLAASPYADALVDVVLDLAGGPDPAVAPHAWRLLTTLAVEHPSARAATVALAETRPSLVPLAMVVLARSDLVPTDDELDAVTRLTAAEQEATRLAAVGVLARHAPQRLARLSPADELTAGAVGWWRELGPALYDRSPSSS